MDLGSKEFKIIATVIGVIVFLTILMNLETRLFGTAYLSKMIGKEADNSPSKKKVQPYAIILLIILVSIPIIYSLLNRK